MLLKPVRWLAPLAFVAGLSPALAQEPVTADTVLAKVGDEVITVGHILLLRSQLPAQYQNLPGEVLYDGLINQAITQVVLSSEVEDPGLLARLVLENESRAVLANVAMDRIATETVTEEALKAAYDVTYSAAKPEEEFRAAHILVATEEEALDLITQLNVGKDFGSLAAEYSTGPSGPGGGDLGWFGRGAMVAPFEEAVLALEPGEISAPVKTQFGWHVITLNETRIVPVPTLEDVRAQLSDEMVRTAVETEAARLRGELGVEQVTPDAEMLQFLNNPSLLEE